jgi:pilus assembly protein Flp/PilA
MQVLTSKIRRFLVSEDGPTAVEYAVMVALIIVACITTITALGGQLSSTFSGLTTTLKDVKTTP